MVEATIPKISVYSMPVQVEFVITININFHNMNSLKSIAQGVKPTEYIKKEKKRNND